MIVDAPCDNPGVPHDVEAVSVDDPKITSCDGLEDVLVGRDDFGIVSRILGWTITIVLGASSGTAGVWVATVAAGSSTKSGALVGVGCAAIAIAAHRVYWWWREGEDLFALISTSTSSTRARRVRVAFDAEGCTVVGDGKTRRADWNDVYGVMEDPERMRLELPLSTVVRIVGPDARRIFETMRAYKIAAGGVGRARR